MAAKKTDRVRPTSVSRRMGGSIKYNDDTMSRMSSDKRWEIAGKSSKLKKALDKKKKK